MLIRWRRLHSQRFDLSCVEARSHALFNRFVCALFCNQILHMVLLNQSNDFERGRYFFCTVFRCNSRTHPCLLGFTVGMLEPRVIEGADDNYCIGCGIGKGALGRVKVGTAVRGEEQVCACAVLVLSDSLSLGCSFLSSPFFHRWP